MSRWKNNFQTQQALERVQNISRTLQSVDFDRFPQGEKEEFARATKVLKILEVRFATLDPELFNQNTWGSFSGWLNNAESYANNVAQNPASGYMQHINNMLDQVLEVLRPLDLQFTEKEVKALADASAVFQQKLVEELERVKSRGVEIASELQALRNAISQAESRLLENDQTIQQQKARLDQSIAEFQKQFLANEATRAKESVDANQKGAADFEATLDAWIAKFETAQQAQQKDFTDLVQSTKKVVTEKLDWMKAKEEEIRRIFNVVGNVAVSGDYKNTAEREKKAADWLRGVAIFLMVVMATGAVIAFVHSLNHPEVDWKLFAFRLGTTLILAVPAFYAAQESAKHREREKLNRKLHLELSSIDSYLELLPPAQRQEIKGKLTERFFGQPDAEDKDEPVTKHELFDLFSKLLQNVTKGK